MYTIVVRKREDYTSTKLSQRIENKNFIPTRVMKILPTVGFMSQKFTIMLLNSF